MQQYPSFARYVPFATSAMPRIQPLCTGLKPSVVPHVQKTIRSKFFLGAMGASTRQHLNSLQSDFGEANQPKWRGPDFQQRRAFTFVPQWMSANHPLMAEYTGETGPGRSPSSFRPRRVVVVTKSTRFEDEAKRISKKTASDMTEEELRVVRNVLKRQGFNVDAIVDSHQTQRNSLDIIEKFLKERSIEYEIVTSGESFQSSYMDEKERHGGMGAAQVEPDSTTSGIHKALMGASMGKRCDLCISAGGDGTFLRAALSITGVTPLIGINTDPTRSRGRLCVGEATGLGRILDSLAEGKYEWVKRQRIQLTLRTMGSDRQGRVLRQCALNEVFIGEMDPCRASVLKTSEDGGATWEKLKCSGLLLSTGTGSTAWMAEATAVTPQDVMDVLRGLNNVYGSSNMSEDLKELLSHGFDAGAVAASTNAALCDLRLKPEDKQLQLLVREPILSVGDISAGWCVWEGTSPSDARLRDMQNPDMHHPSARSIVDKLHICSVGVDAQLVLDGRIYIPLERGVEAILQSRDEHALWSVRIESEENNRIESSGD